MTVIPLEPSHAAAYRELMLHTYEHDADAFTSTAEERRAEPESFWVRRIAQPDGLARAFGAFDGDRLVGTVGLEFSKKPKTAHQALLLGMAVLAPWRGRGLGRALVQAALDACRARPGVATVVLTATEGNEAAIGLYRRCGFEVFGTEPMAILTPSGYKAKVHMWCRLPAPVPDQR